jgi:carbonic anhydrase
MCFPIALLPLLSSFYLVVVVGHSGCGGATASLNAVQRASSAANLDRPIVTVPSLPPDASLNRWLGPLTENVKTLELSNMSKEEALQIVVEENVKWQVDNVCRTQTLIDAWSNDDPRKNKVWVHGWIYDLATGLLKDLEITRGPPTSI